VALAQLDAVAYGRGPGSFTGLRIAAGTAQGLAYGLDRPLLGVSTLETLALHAHRRHGQTHSVTAMDARMGEIYVAAWQCGADGIEALLPEAVMAPQALQLPSLQVGNEWYGIGSGWALAESMPVTTLALVSQRKATTEPAAEAKIGRAHAELQSRFE